ncbi:MAG TPA: DUF1080 domain-containing protein [Verrucomicrobiota bacterium]|nr:DUF1080 domain-containing protein [Verrucomicrobiales bacterium]HRI14010.1 DUF1080 domain-containing protein [Verrucomicrobiota bacterium]
MKIAALGLLCISLVGLAAEPQALFDGKTFNGWDGDTNKTWRIRDGMIVGGSLETQVPRNEFLATTRSFTNFVLRVKFKLEGTEGFVNSGVQFRSQRIPNDAEMIGYQADIGDGWWGALYDESRRNTVMAKPEEGVGQKAAKKGEWNDYEIRCEGPRIVLKLNGVTTVDYTEADPAIPRSGRIGVQVHGGGKTLVSFKDITLQPLP